MRRPRTLRLPLMAVASLALVASAAVPAAAAEATDVGMASRNGCALLSDGTVECGGQIGWGNDSPDAAVIVTDSSGRPLTDVTGGSFDANGKCVIRSDTSVWCWSFTQPVPKKVKRTDGTPLLNVTQVSANGGHSCARTSAGKAWCWGNGMYGQLGDGKVSGWNVIRDAVKVVKQGGGELDGVVQVTVGDRHSCAALAGGSAWCWGNDNLGQLGDGSSGGGFEQIQPRATRVVRVAGGYLTGVARVTTGATHSCAKLSSGRAACWGENAAGQLGIGSRSDRAAAVTVKLSGKPLESVKLIDAGNWTTCATTGDVRKVWCWGTNSEGALGTDKTISGSTKPIRVVKAESGVKLQGAESLSIGTDAGCVLVAGDPWCWGDSGARVWSKKGAILIPFFD
jgi:hypothetical protein